MTPETKAVDGREHAPETPVETLVFAEAGETLAELQPLLGRKWYLRIVSQLIENGPMGFSALKTAIDGISSKMLSESLSDLETAGIVDRTVVSEQPVRVQYSLTESGEALEPVVASLLQWARNNDVSWEDR
jgi:DNA-binding HxlR family transcriptional regulator